MTDHLLLDLVKLTGSVAVRSLESYRGKDKDGRPVARLDVDMWGIVLLRPKEEPVGTEAVNGGHADLSGCRRGVHHQGDRFTAAYRASERSSAPGTRARTGMSRG